MVKSGPPIEKNDKLSTIFIIMLVQKLLKGTTNFGRELDWILYGVSGSIFAEISLLGNIISCLSVVCPVLLVVYYAYKGEVHEV